MANPTHFIVVLVAQSTWVLICGLVFIFEFEFLRTPFFSFGPSSDLRIIGLGITVDTWTKYLLLVSYIFIDTFVRYYVADTVFPWINSVVMNPDIEEINVSKTFAWSVSNYTPLLFSINSLFNIGLTMSQFDFFLVSTISGVISGAITTLISVKAKRVVIKETEVDVELDLVV